LATFAGSNPATAEWRYHLTDHLGSVRQLSGQTKAALARYDYAPYGELMRNAGLPLTVGYTGHLWDSAIGQYYAPFRYYNPQTARWNMRDPLGVVDGPNMYAYVAGNPVNGIDPTGGCVTPETIWDIGNLGYDLVYGSWWDVGFDAIAVALPIVPAGLTKVGKIAKISGRIPGDTRYLKNVDDVFKRLKKYHGIDHHTASQRLHKLKSKIKGSRKNPDVIFDRTGGVYSPTGEFLGSLTEGGKKCVK